MAWGLEPGAEIRRVELHDEYGGGRQGGIAPSRLTDNVLIFTDPSVGSQHGYDDRWEMLQRMIGQRVKETKPA